MTRPIRFVLYFLPQRIQRERGTFGTVQIHWQIVYNGSSNQVQDGSDFEVVAGSVVFAERQTTQQIEITSRMDGRPEFEEFFNLVLVNVTGKSQ